MDRSSARVRVRVRVRVRAMVRVRVRVRVRVIGQAMDRSSARGLQSQIRIYKSGSAVFDRRCSLTGMIDFRHQSAR
jgi:hypothetical protein